MKKFYSLLLLLTAICIVLTACGQDAASNFDEEVEAEEENEADGDLPDPSGVTMDDLLDVKENHTVRLEGGTVTFRLEEAYAGEAAQEALSQMGEDPEDFVPFESDMQLVLLAYQITVEDGYTDTPFRADELLGTALWSKDLSNLYEYYLMDLNKNQALTYTQVSVSAGESSPCYVLYQLPDTVTSFVAPVESVDGTLWFLYSLSV